MRTGCWTLLYLQLPGHERTPAGVLLWDSLDDSLLFSQRELFEDEKGSSMVEFWEGFARLLASVIDEKGGLAALLWLESEASHILQVGVRTEIQISAATSQLNSLFADHVSFPGTRAKFGENEIDKAQAQLPMLPSIAVQVIAAMNDPRADSRDIEQAVSRDPVLAASLMRIANSAAFSVRDPARTVGSAIQRIGFDATRLHILGLVVGKMYSSPRLRKVWEHSVSAAQVARDLARASGQNQGEASLIALIHDIGQIVMFAIGDEFNLEYARLEESGVTNVAAETALCGISHAEVGANLLAAWHFPEDMCEAVRNHHTPSNTKSSFAAILYLAESSLERNEDIYDPAERVLALDRLGIQRPSVKGVRESLDADLQALCSTA